MIATIILRHKGTLTIWTSTQSLLQHVTPALHGRCRDNGRLRAVGLGVGEDICSTLERTHHMLLKWWFLCVPVGSLFKEKRLG